MKSNISKLSLRKDTIRVLSTSEMRLVIGGLAAPIQAARHPTFVCAAKQFAAVGTIVR
ncbi:MAG: class I lanthipeptide [Pirellulales bacterium]